MSNSTDNNVVYLKEYMQTGCKTGNNNFQKNVKFRDQHKRILLVDDDDSILELLSFYFNRTEYIARTSKNGAEALKLFTLEYFDLVITDLRMPGINGCELGLNIKNMAPNVPVILMTGSKDENSLINTSIQKGYIDSVIFKPFAIRCLNDMIRTFLYAKAEEK